MAKLHQILAVESDLEGKYKRVCEETRNIFGKPAMFIGFNRKLEVWDDNDRTDYPEENQAMTTSVPDRLDYTGKSIVKYLDALYQKEATNQEASADLVVNGEVIVANVPATMLLALEARLKYIRSVYENIPTLTAGNEWEKAPEKGDNVWNLARPEEKLKTEMQYKSSVLYDATKEHPAQIEKWQEQVPVGKFVKNIWSGMVTSARKAVLLGRIDDLIRGAKMSRQKANSTDVCKGEIGTLIMNLINQ